MLNRRQFMIAATTAAAATVLGGCAAKKVVPEERSMNFGFEDLVTATPRWADYGPNLQKAHVNAISLAVGRTDWLAFEWSTVPEISASMVQESGTDYVAEALDKLGKFLPKDYQLTLTIDALLRNWISQQANLAGTTPSGKKSSEFASVTALTEGAVAERLVNLVGELCTRYTPHRIALTELMFDNATFGEEDLKSYCTTTGAKDWPRRNDGSINESHASIGQWRSKALASLLSKVKAEARRHDDTQLDVDVRAPWDDAEGDRTESGHNYKMLLESVDRIVVWNYFGLENKPPTYGGEVTKELKKSFSDNFTMSSGLWAPDNQTVSPRDLETSLQAVAKAGANSVSVTPASMMTPDHWHVLEKIWAED